jgi:Family of unknown function (DUF6256)
VILREVFAPVLAAFAVCVLMVVHAWAHPVPRPRASRAVRSAADLRGMLRCLAVTAVGGYVVLLVVVLVFGVLIVGDGGALRSAAWSTAFLLAVAIPFFVVLSVAFGRRTG